MKRVTEPELMESIPQAMAYANADFSLSEEKMMRHLTKFLKSKKKILDSSSLIIDLGCGPGNMTERLAKFWPSSNILGIDGSQQMINIAQQRMTSTPHRSGSLSYICSNISFFTKSNYFLNQAPDLIVSNSLLHHIHDPHNLWMTIKNLVVPGSVMFHRDLKRPISENQVSEIQQKLLPSAPKVLLNDFIASLKAAFTPNELEIQLSNANYSNYKVIEVDEIYLEVFATF